MSKNSQDKTFNRWIVVFGAFVIQLALGTIYCWGTLTIFVSPYLGVPATATVYIFGIGLLSFALTMIFAGRLQQKIGPMKTAILGGIVLASGEILSAFASDFTMMLITHGIVAGAGIGLGYVCPIATAVKWFPDKKGLINGLAVAGFGAGAFAFNYIIRLLANPLQLEITDPNFLTTVAQTVPTTFISLGITYLVMVIGGAFTLRLPPEGWKPKGWEPTVASEESGISGLDFTQKETVKLPQFWLIWGAFVLSAISGLMVIGSFANFAKSVDDSNNYLYVIGTSNFIMVGSLAALFNGVGRIMWGKISDIITYKKAMPIMFSIQGVLMFIYFFTNADNNFFLIFTCAIYFCFGGNFSLFPTATADLFGTKNLGANYGIVFTAYGIAGFVGATMVSVFVTAFGGYFVLFIFMGVMSIAAGIISFKIKPPK